jgi:GT2 family glycosyltransferase
MADRIAPVSVIIPTWRRLSHLQKTLAKLAACTPAAAETVVHVDAGDGETAPWLREYYPQVKVLTSNQQMGPGGSRNRLLAAATQPYVASFDDDSYPLDHDYFARLVEAFNKQPDAGMFAAVVIHRGETPPVSITCQEEVVDFMGCACAYRKEAWDETEGYVPRSVPYGAEEIDVALQLIDQGWKIIKDHSLRVLHDTNLSHHLDAKKTAGAIENRALLAYVRYPVSYLWWGIGQYISRIAWSLRYGRTEGIGEGVWHTPKALWQHRRLRNPVRFSTIRRCRQLMR